MLVFTNQKSLESYDRHDVGHNESEGEQSSHVKELITKFEPTLPKDVLEQYAHKGKNKTIDKTASDNKQRGGSTDSIDKTDSDDKQRVGSTKNIDDKQRAASANTIDKTASDGKQRGCSTLLWEEDCKRENLRRERHDSIQERVPDLGELYSDQWKGGKNPSSDHIEQATNPKTSSTSDDRNSCQITFGSYCLWQQEHRQEMKETLIKKLKDQLFVTRAYYPSIAKLPAKDKLSRQLKQNIQEMEHMLSESTSDADLPPV
ncbi:hypothetical protein V8G54_020545 [Vigna mungo]|uniref:Uncharacterized protein n=1 Tax=Vigna mungo TaxID=3915 RepID=A0AAQ3NC11_VIGMU